MIASPKSLKSFIVAAAAAVSIVGFVSAYLILTSAYERSIHRDARATAEVIAQQGFNSMFEVMRKGWSRDDLEAFIAAQQAAFKESPFTLEIYRGPKVEAQFGPIEQALPNEAVRLVFETGQDQRLEQDDTLRHIFPLKARGECLQCHAHVQPGDVLGVMEVRQDMGPALAHAREGFLTNLVLLIPLPLLMAALLALFINRRLQTGIDGLRDRVAQLNKVDDLKRLSIGEMRMGFSELDGILREVDQMVQKLRGFAVDKDLLEFEVRLLERFVITSDVVRDWREYVERMLLEINEVVEAYTLFSLFKVDEEMFDLEIFWRAPPSDATRDMLEEAARQALTRLPALAHADGITVHHHVANPEAPPLVLSRRDIDVATKSLVVESPKIGGIVGIGVQAEIARDEVRQLVVESLLSTLLNVVGSVKAISKYTKDLEYYASRDPLTNLYNRRVFWELLDYEQGRAERHDHRFALLVIDMDNFKSVNDTYGHHIGDRFLQAFADTLKPGLRKGDVFARYGGDEFVIMLPEVEGDQAYQVAQRLLHMAGEMSIEAPDGSRIRATVSIGVAVYPDHASSSRDLFLFADNMMYRAKAEGKNRLAVPSDQDVIDNFRQVSETIALVTRALEERWVEPYFQPIVASADGTLHAHEVLSRITMPDGQLVQAGAFVETAEQLGLVHKLDFIVMEKALQKAAEAGYEGLLFLNISPRALVLNEFFATVKRLANEAGILPERLVFELTERETVKNPAMLEKFVTRLHLEGFKFAIDDFGSGFSSFHYIKRFPIDYIKLEGDFVVNMLDDERDAAFVRSISALARDLGIRTIAEYVESEAIMDAIRKAGIDHAQGYHVGRPSPNLLSSAASPSASLDGAAAQPLFPA
ncbi:MAG: bifunctional diguanylate cyclase/phosphodiesterase [Pseudomonadota bacterium]